MGEGGHSIFSLSGSICKRPLEMKVVRSVPPAGAMGKSFYRADVEAKQGNCLNGYGLSS